MSQNSDGNTREEENDVDSMGDQNIGACERGTGA
jgi:hypothetical protein